MEQERQLSHPEKPKSPLLALPEEIRRNIYEQVWGSFDELHVHFHGREGVPFEEDIAASRLLDAACHREQYSWGDDFHPDLSPWRISPSPTFGLLRVARDLEVSDRHLESLSCGVGGPRANVSDTRQRRGKHLSMRSNLLGSCSIVALGSPSASSKHYRSALPGTSAKFNFQTSALYLSPSIRSHSQTLLRAFRTCKRSSTISMMIVCYGHRAHRGNDLESVRRHIPSFCL